jgi:hypothetical protein
MNNTIFFTVQQIYMIKYVASYMCSLIYRIKTISGYAFAGSEHIEMMVINDNPVQVGSCIKVIFIIYFIISFLIIVILTNRYKTRS